MKRVNILPVVRPERRVYSSSDVLRRRKLSKENCQDSDASLFNNSKGSGGLYTTYTTPPAPFNTILHAGAREDKVSNKKNQVNLDDLLNLADQLNEVDKKTLLARLSLAAQNRNSEPDRDKDMWAQAAYDELLRVFGQNQGVGQGLALIKRSLGASQVWAPLADFMKSSGLNKLQVTERYAVYCLLAQLVVKQAKYIANKIDAPLGVKLIGNCLVNVASLFDNAFPGYLGAGLAPIVARQFCQKRNTSQEF